MSIFGRYGPYSPCIFLHRPERFHGYPGKQGSRADRSGLRNDGQGFEDRDWTLFYAWENGDVAPF